MCLPSFMRPIGLYTRTQRKAAKRKLSIHKRMIQRPLGTPTLHKTMPNITRVEKIADTRGWNAWILHDLVFLEEENENAAPRPPGTSE